MSCSESAGRYSNATFLLSSLLSIGFSLPLSSEVVAVFLLRFVEFLPPLFGLSLISRFFGFIYPRVISFYLWPYHRFALSRTSSCICSGVGPFSSSCLSNLSVLAIISEAVFVGSVTVMGGFIVGTFNLLPLSDTAKRVPSLFVNVLDIIADLMRLRHQ